PTAWLYSTSSDSRRLFGAQSSGSRSGRLTSWPTRRLYAERTRTLKCVAGTLIARKLVKAHGAATILGGVSLTVAPGDVVGVVGPKGAGKSPLLRLLAGVDAPDSGSVSLTAGTAGYLPQEPDRAPGERLLDYLARRTGIAAADAEVQEATLAIAEDP